MERPKNGTHDACPVSIFTILVVLGLRRTALGHLRVQGCAKEKIMGDFTYSDTYASFMQDQLNSQLLPSAFLTILPPEVQVQYRYSICAL